MPLIYNTVSICHFKFFSTLSVYTLQNKKIYGGGVIMQLHAFYILFVHSGVCKNPTLNAVV